MAGTNLASILGAVNRAGLVKTAKAGLPTVGMPAGLLTGGQTFEGDQCTVYQVAGNRKTARRVEYDAPSRRRTHSGVTEKPYKMLHFKENTQLKVSCLMNLLSYDGARQRLGDQEVQRIVGECRQILDNNRIAAVMSAFALGHIYHDSSGNLLPSSSSNLTDVDYGIPSGNKNQLAINGGSSVLTTSWAVKTAPIVKMIQSFKRAAMKYNGYLPEVAWYGANIFDYLTSNDSVSEYMKRNPGFQNAFGQGEIPDGFLGMKWVPAYMQFFEDNNGTAQSIFGDDNITFTPMPSSDWYEMFEGTYPVPTDFTSVSSGDLQSVIDKAALTAGMFNYCYGQIDPPSATMIYGDTFLPAIKVPGAVYIATVVF